MQGRTTVAIVVFLHVVLGSAPTARAETKLYFDRTIQLDQQQMNSAARGFGSVADAYLAVCNDIASGEKALGRIRVPPRLTWVARTARLMLKYGARIKRVDPRALPRLSIDCWKLVCLRVRAPSGLPAFWSPSSCPAIGSASSASVSRK